MTQVTAIVVTYNSADVIASALGSLPLEIPVMVVDNASNDTSCARVTAMCPHATMLKNSENLGFGRANNRALREIKTPYALLLNPDAVLEMGALEALLDAAQRTPDAAILAPLLVERDGRIFEFKRTVFTREESAGKFVAPEGEACFPWASGAVWLLNMEALKKIGLFDEKLFLYYEDDDLCLRARAAGYSVVAVPQARAHHGRGRSSTPSREGERLKQFHLTWSRLYLEEKYHGHAHAKRLALKLVVRHALKSLRPGRGARHRARLKAAVAFFRSSCTS